MTGVTYPYETYLMKHKLYVYHCLSRVNAAFFTANGWLSVVFSVLGIVDVLVSGTPSR